MKATRNATLRIVRGTLGTVSFLAVAALALGGTSSAQAATIIGYWGQNDNGLPGGGFGFTPASFPQVPDLGGVSLNLRDFDTTVGGADNAYTTIQSFAGTDLSAQSGFPSGGSLSPQGGPIDAGSGEPVNNGMSIVLAFETLGLQDIGLQWDQRGTSSGFTSRAVSYSLDGTSFTPFGTDSGALSSTWTTPTFDFSGISALNDQPAVYLAITLDGATGPTGNNRFDNITITGTVIPEPSASLLLVLGTSWIGMRRRN
jgi:hypothetical protein